MPKKQQRTIGVLIIQLALAIYLIITGLCLFGIGGSISSSEIQGVTSFFKGGANAVEYVIGVLLIACGVIFFLKALGLDFGKADDLIKYITLIVWIVVTAVTQAFSRHSLLTGHFFAKPQLPLSQY